MNKKYKILFVSHSPFYNGAELCLLTLVKYLNRELFEPIVVFPNKGPLVDDVQKLGIKTIILPMERWIRYNFEKKIKNSDLISRSKLFEALIDDELIDIVHTNSSVILEGAIAAKKMNVPHIWHIHEFLNNHPELSTVLPLPFTFYIISALSDKIVCVSDFAKKQFKPIVSEEKLFTIYNGVEVRKGNQTFKKGKIGVSNDEIIAVTVGMLTERKGYPNLLRAIEIVQKSGCKVKFLWVGEASKETLKIFDSNKKKLGIDDSIIYIGFSKDITNILSQSNIYICSSVNEAFPLVVLEAMSIGLPVISTNWGGASECVIDEVTGYIVPVNDPVKLAEKIMQLCQDAEKLKEFGLNGLNHYTNNFTASVYATRFQDLYKEVIKERVAKQIIDKEENLIESFLEVYEIISNNHWDLLKKKR